MPNIELIKKLRLDKYQKKLVLNLPAFVTDLEGLEFDRQITRDTYDLILAFVLNLEEMAAIIRQVDAQNLLTDNGLLYLVYPKKGNKIYPSLLAATTFSPIFTSPLKPGWSRALV